MEKIISVVPSVIKRNRNIHSAAEGVLLSAGSTIRIEGKKMRFCLSSLTLNNLEERVKNMDEITITPSIGPHPRSEVGNFVDSVEFVERE